MDDRDAFERQVAAEMARRAGPVQPVDDAAIYAAITSAVPSPRRRFHSWFHSTDARTVPVPATTGHTPTVRERTPLMLNPAKAIAVVALVFAVGGLLTAQPRGPDIGSAPASSPEPGQPGVSPTAGQSETPLESQAPLDPLGASYWTGTYTGTGGELGVTDSRDGYFEEMGGILLGEVAADDPRIAGRMTQVYNTNSTVGPEPERNLAFVNGTARIDNDAGAWVGTYTGWNAGWLGDEFFVLKGEGAYEGLTAVFQWLREDKSLQGVDPGGRTPATAGPGRTAGRVRQAQWGP